MEILVLTEYLLRTSLYFSGLLEDQNFNIHKRVYEPIEKEMNKCGRQ